MKAVIVLQGHQYIVVEWDTLVGDKMTWKEGEKVDIDTVLLTFDDDGEKVSVGTPYVKGAVVSTKILKHQKGDKVKVFKFQGKKRYHRTRGFKPSQTVLSIEKIKA